ncbi:restriction endonuclease subunit S [Marinobacterium sp. AK62]|uniref:Restriction endonuclease subunit S n=1 Tax=Marinobacterium alkalitolerans TaxID=1542925 RepID=A0ABS3Z7E8_9GAMM|nr:restriction endonuclease subunit S [Marinobacterium alkalitolerans]MBP0047634.1 restriction endonuclease subunit S [Marinobacterium alkalitolerans]
MSAQELITDHLDLWTGAVTKKSSSGRGSNGKIELTGIKKLRELILELAVSGRLVSQSPEDTLFKEHLLWLRREHAPIKARGRKTVSGDVTGDEQPFDIPRTWTWTRLGEIVEVLDSQRKPITKAARKSGPYPYYGASGIVDYVDGYLFDEPLVLVGEDGAKWDKGEATAFSISGKSWVNNHAHVLRPRREAVTDEYLVYYITAADLSPYITGMTVPKLNQARLASIPVATPCLEEQHRIVQKVDELMALCDRLEQQTSDQLDAHETLVDTLLGTLTQSENASELADNWARLAAHFDTLFTTEQSIDKLKQAILQLAVMGRLVEQNAGDEPAASYLALSGIKATTANTPQNWVTAELGTLGTILGGATPSKKNADYWAGEIPWVSPKDMKTDYISSSQDQISNTAIESTSLRLIPPHSLLMVVRGMILAHSFPVAMTLAPVTINQDMKALIPPRDLAPYLLLFLKAHKATVTSLVDHSTHGTCKLKSEKLWLLPVHVPPLAEQTKILQKVDELMALCDQLKKRLNQASETRCQLAEAVMKKAVS